MPLQSSAATPAAAMAAAVVLCWEQVRRVEWEGVECTGCCVGYAERLEHGQSFLLYPIRMLP